MDALVREGKVAVDAGVAELAAESAPVRVPASLEAVIAERLSALPEETVTVLRWAAVLGQEFRVTDLEMVTGRSAADLAGVLDPAVAMGVVTEAGGKLAFRHGLIRQPAVRGRAARTPAALPGGQGARGGRGAGGAGRRAARARPRGGGGMGAGNGWPARCRCWLTGCRRLRGNCCGASSRRCPTATPGGSRCRPAWSWWRSCSASTTRCSRPDASCWPAAVTRTGARRSPG